jgi:hypothetical protein
VDVRSGRRADCRPLTTSAPFGFEVVKAVGWGGAGFALKWFLGRLSGDASDIRAALGLVEQTARDADAAMRTMMLGQPDLGRAATVMSDRQTIIIRTGRALGRCADYATIQRAHEQFALSIRFVDPHFGVMPTEADVHSMRAAEVLLHRAILDVAGKTWAWRIASHERGK